MTFANHGPVAIHELTTAMVFLEKPADIAVYTTWRTFLTHATER